MPSLPEVVIVGSGQAGLQVAASLRTEGFQGAIRLIGDELHLPYQRPPLSKAFLKKQATAASVKLRPLDFFHEQQIDLLTGTRITSIEPSFRRLWDQRGQAIRYDHLVLATGTRPRKLGLPGANLGNVFYLRSLSDAEQLLASLEGAQSVVIIGGGFIGLEAAACFAGLGKSVVVLEGGTRVMGRAVAPQTSAYFQQYHATLGIDLVTDARIAALQGNGKVQSVLLEDGRAFPCDLVLVGIGALPNSELAEQARMRCQDGIVVNAQCRTSDPYIYAVGDCARFPSPHADEPIRLESVQNAIDQAKVVAANLMGGTRRHEAVPWFWSDQGQMKLQTTGLPSRADRCITRGVPESGKFSVFHLQQNRIVAVDSVNAPAEHMLCRKLVGIATVAVPEVLADPGFDLKALLAAAPGASANPINIAAVSVAQ